MDILVTGSKGFLGKKICERLRVLGYNVDEIDFGNGQDINKLETFSPFSSAKLIIHLAAKSYVPDSMNNPIDFYNTNIIGTLNVLETARKNQARVIFFSSYIYGNPEFLPVTEIHSKNPHNPYAQSKLIGEDLCFAYYRDFNVPSIVFRPFNIYGPGQVGNFLFPTILNQISSGKIKLKDPLPKRDYIHCDDIVEAVVQAVKKDELKFETFNLGTGVSFSVKDIMDIIRLNSQSNFDVEFENVSRKSEVLDCYADITKTKKLLNWTPAKNLETGIKELLKIYNL